MKRGVAVAVGFGVLVGFFVAVGTAVGVDVAVGVGVGLIKGIRRGTPMTAAMIMAAIPARTGSRFGFTFFRHCDAS